MRRPLLAAIVLVTVSAGGCAKAAPSGDSGSDASAFAAVESVDDGTLGSGDLALTPHVADAASCADLFRGGELVDMTGDGFAPSGRVTVIVMPRTPEATTQVVSSDNSGDIALTVMLPKKLKGVKVGGDLLGYVEADGPGATSTHQSDNAIFGIGNAEANCSAAPPSGGMVTVVLSGSDGPEVPSAGAVFAITGPGLPPLVGTTGGSGELAELVTTAVDGTVCPSKEPTGVHCTDGSIEGLRVGQTYTATEVKPPAQFAGAPPQTFTATADETGLYFLNTYLGPAPPASLIVYVGTGANSAEVPAGAVFAVTGPGLPPLRSAGPIPGVVAELDATTHAFACSYPEPRGVDCERGVLMDLSPGTAYTVTELTPPPGYPMSPPQTVQTPTDGSSAVVLFTVALAG
jgi:hypothetical protein